MTLQFDNVAGTPSIERIPAWPPGTTAVVELRR